MNNQGLVVSSLNSIIEKIQCVFSHIPYIEKVSDIINKIIFFLILGIFILSTFASSGILGGVALVIFALTVLNLFLQKGEKLEMNLFEKFIFVWFLIVIISLFGSSLFALSFKGFLKTATYMGFYFSVVQFFRKNPNTLPSVIFTISLCAVWQGILGISQNFKGVEEISTWQDTSSINPEQVMTRIYGSLKPLNPNLYAGYLISTLPCLFWSAEYFCSKRNINLCIISVFSILTTIIATILSGCRGAYIALAFMLLCFALYIGKRIFDTKKDLLKKIYIGIVSAIFTLGIFAAMLVTSIRTRIFSIFVFRADSSTSFRMNVYQAAINMIKDNWILGIGVGNKNFREIYGLYMKTGFDALSTYNVFTELWVESGVFSLFAYLGFLFVLTKKALWYIISNKKNSSVVAISIISILSVMIHGFVDTIYFRPQVQFVFWTMAAMISAVLYNEEKEII